jgi:hypothetical protein
MNKYVEQKPADLENPKQKVPPLAIQNKLSQQLSKQESFVTALDQVIVELAENTDRRKQKETETKKLLLEDVKEDSIGEFKMSPVKDGKR